jgi:hypothetical protein
MSFVFKHPSFYKKLKTNNKLTSSKNTATTSSSNITTTTATNTNPPPIKINSLKDKKKER